jgi:hypothetical protein
VIFTSGFPIQAGKALNLSPDSLTATANDDPANWCIASVSYNGDLGTPAPPTVLAVPRPPIPSDGAICSSLPKWSPSKVRSATYTAAFSSMDSPTRAPGPIPTPR